MKKNILFFAALFGAISVSAFGSLDELLPKELEDAKGNPVSLDTLEGKVIGLYFSAEWCPPCRGFTPELVEFRNSNKENFEVVFISSDRTPEDQRKYMSGYDMDFLAVEHNSKWTNLLREKYSIRGIPSLVIIDSDGKLITENGRADVSRNAANALAQWQDRAGD